MGAVPEAAAPRARDEVAHLRVEVAQLQHALNSRIVIEQAKGILSERLGLSMDEAFDVLRQYARSGGLKLQHVAAEVVAGVVRPGPAQRVT